MLPYKEVKIIDSYDLDNFVRQTYGKPYRFQQQNGCQGRGIVHVTVPELNYEESFEDDIPLKVNGDEMGISFKTWLNTDPQQHKEMMDWSDYDVELFWERNFYPDIYMVLNDLYNRGLVEAGDYIIDIDW